VVDVEVLNVYYPVDWEVVWDFDFCYIVAFSC
jgi:hypothetical protein